jgi:hypothetical protein
MSAASFTIEDVPLMEFGVAIAAGDMKKPKDQWQPARGQSANQYNFCF